VRTESPQLLPLFRSDGQGRLLARVYLGSDRPAPIAALARELGLDAGGLTREADRLERAGLVRSERIGRQRILRPNPESPYHDDLRGLLMTAFGPATAIAEALAGVPRIDEAHIFGSWAARYAGIPGPDPADIDVLIVGTPSRATVARALTPLVDQLGREVNDTIVSAARWRRADEGFIRHVKDGPLVPLDVRPADRDG
jgi:predicted nucleotidyltransferase